MILPRVTKIGIPFRATRPVDLEKTLRSGFARIAPSIRKGSRVAIAVGSRGISNLDSIVRLTVENLEKLGASPFVVAAMGSHGGGTIEGQLAVLAEYGITEAAVGAPVLATTEVAELTAGSRARPFLVNRLAFEADAIIPVNRIKKHTDIHGAHESGLLKMLAIGLGNNAQAEILHAAGLEQLRKGILEASFALLATGKIPFGVGIVENALGDTACLEVIPGARIAARERTLLRYAKQLSPSLPVENLDVLVIDRGGKDLSGSCIDTNVIGRMALRSEKDLATPRISRVVVADLSDKSHGNAAGIGLADFITRRFHEKIDFASTNRNCLSCWFPERGMIPIVAETDRQAIEFAISTAQGADPRAPRLIRIPDTLHLDELYVSDAVLEELEARPRVGEGIECKGFSRIGASSVELVDDSGNLSPF